LSELARARMQADLPVLLAAVRWRRRRRRLVRTGVALLVLGVAFAVWVSRGDPTPAPVAPGPVAQPRWITVRDDLQIVSRLQVSTAVRAEWFLDDAGLQALLRTGDRPDGLVRVDQKVLVSGAAVDAFPALSP
jgi:hypothetical protein